MSPGLGVTLRELRDQIRFPIGAALLALGIVRLLLSAARSCQELACDDFGRFWYATSAWIENGRSLYAATPASFANNGLYYSNLNLPHTHLLFMPFACLPRDVGAAAWLGVGLAAVALAASMVARETAWRPSGLWLLVFVWWMPTHVQVVTGQIAWVMLPLIALGWRSVRLGNWPMAGVAVGVAIAMKPFLLPYMAWLAWRRAWSAVQTCSATIAAVFALGWLVFGTAAYEEWTKATGIVDWYARSNNASLWGAAYRLFTSNIEFAPLANDPDVARALALAGGLLVALVCWYFCRFSDDVSREWSLVLAASLLLSPLGWVYYGVWLLPGLKFKWPGAAATACWLVPTPFLIWQQPAAWATLLWGSAATWGLVLAFTHVARLQSPESLCSPDPRYAARR